MKNSSIIIKALSLVVSAVLIFTFIIPKFEAIRMTQDNIVSYQEQIANVTQINAQLQNLVSEVEAVSNRDQIALQTFLPDQVDSIAVLRTLQNITESSGVEVSSLEYVDSESLTDRPLDVHTFAFTASGSYEEIGQLISSLEQNRYLFEFQQVDLATEAEGGLSIDVQLDTYSLQSPIDQSTTNSVQN